MMTTPGHAQKGGYMIGDDDDGDDAFISKQWDGRIGLKRMSEQALLTCSNPPQASYYFGPRTKVEGCMHDSRLKRI